MAGGVLRAAVGLTVAAAGGRFEPVGSAWRLGDIYVSSAIAMAALFFAFECKPLRTGLANATRLEPTTVPSTPPFHVQRIAATCLAVTLGRAVGEVVGYAWEPATSPSRR